MKKKAFVAAIAIICIAVATSETLAFFTAEETTGNVITSGGIDIEVVEKTIGENEVLMDFPEEGIKNVLPGTVVSKIVQVKNTGVSDAWIRVKVNSVMTDENGNNIMVTSEVQQPAITFQVLKGWIKGEDGYYYFSSPVTYEALTEALFEEVKFEETMGNEYQNTTAHIIISAEAVQTANNGSNVLEAIGWPVESTE